MWNDKCNCYALNVCIVTLLKLVGKSHGNLTSTIKATDEPTHVTIFGAAIEPTPVTTFGATIEATT